MLFKQLFEPESSTYTYLLGCPQTGRAVLLDPVLETIERDLKTIQELGLHLAYTMETHIHADHVSSARKLKTLTGSQIVAPAMDQLPCADIGVTEGKAFTSGSITLWPLFTPGHTNSHHSYLLDMSVIKCVFTGDALLIDGCGRTDFQNGDPISLFNSIHQKLFVLPDDTLVYPAHDYQNRHVSSIAQERERNPRLSRNNIESFVAVMSGLNLPYPKKMDFSVPANLACGECPHNLPEEMKKLCDSALQG